MLVESKAIMMMAKITSYSNECSLSSSTLGREHFSDENFPSRSCLSFFVPNESTAFVSFSSPLTTHQSRNYPILRLLLKCKPEAKRKYKSSPMYESTFNKNNHNNDDGIGNVILANIELEKAFCSLFPVG